VAIFSVYDYDRKQFDYYQTTDDVTHQALGSVKFGSFRSPRPTPGKKSFGNIAESIAYKLPSSARKIGSGDMPRGVIASGLGGSTVDVFGLNVPVGKLAVGAAIVGIALLWSRRKK
jgi:hypothetical protein